MSKASFQNRKPKLDRSCLFIGCSVLSFVVNSFTLCKLPFRIGGGGGSERENLLLVWDSFLQSQEIQVEYSMSSIDNIKKTTLLDFYLL